MLFRVPIFSMPLAAHRFNAGAVGLGFGLAGGADGLGLAHRLEPHRLGVAGGLLDMGIGGPFGDVHPLLGSDDLVLNIGQRRLADELLASLDLRMGFGLVLGDGFDAAADVEFLADVFDVGANGFGADVELVADFLVNEARG